MARADWGGGADYSGVFANIAEIWQNRVESATNRAIRQADEEQAALDADTYDKWKNGMLTDEEWLDYIETRVEESKGDPQEHAEWVKMQREHETGIRDSQAEASYENGEISVHAIIGYYKDRLNGLEKNSPEYREVQSRLNNYVETRDSDQIYDEAEAIIDRIERGRGTYTELLSYYQNKLKTLNPNSALYKQVKREINSVRDIVDAVGARSGGGGGGGSGRRSGGSGSGGGGASAEVTAQINELIVSSRRGGSLYNPTAPDPILQTAQYMNIESVEDLEMALESDRDRIQYLIEYERDNPSATVLVDQWGNQYEKTPEFLHALDDMMIRTFEQKWALKWIDGDADGASKELLRMGSYIGDHMQRHNSADMKPAWDKQVQSAMALVNSASMIGDPAKQQSMYREASRMVDRFVVNANNEVTRTQKRGAVNVEGEKRATFRQNVSVEARAREELADAKLQSEMAWMSEFLAAAGGRAGADGDSVHAALSDVIDRRPEGLKFTQSDLEDIALGDPNTGRMGVIETYDAAQGLLDGTWVWFGDGAHVRPVPIETVNSMQQQLGAENRKLVPTFEKGKVVYRTTEPPDRPFTVWVDEDGVPISPVKLQNMEKFELENARARGEIQEREFAPGWERVTMSDGKQWYIDPSTGLFYKTMPIQYQTDPTGRLLIDDITGEPTYRFEPFAHARGVVAPFAGMSPAQAQQLVREAESMGIINPENYFVRDENGNSIWDNPILEGMYWSQSDAIAEEAMRRSRLNARGTLRKRGREPEGPPLPANFLRNRSVTEKNELAWNKRMAMVHKAEKDSFREDARLSSMAEPDNATATSPTEFASSLGIRIGGREELSARQVQSFDRFKQQEGRMPAVKPPTPKLPPAKLAPLSDPKIREMPKPPLPDPMANSQEAVKAKKKVPPPPPTTRSRRAGVREE